MNDAAAVLIVDDDPITLESLASYFEKEGFSVYPVSTAEEGEEILAKTPIDLVLLDIRLPGKDGLTLTRELRVRSEVGIILVTGRQDEIDRIVGLECGADDYITKPFNMRETLARAKNLIRRVQHSKIATQTSNEESAIKHFHNWTLDLNRRVLIDSEQEETSLTHGEFQLLIVFINNAGRTLSRDQLMDQIRNREWVPSDRTIDVLVGRLRRKIKDDPAKPSMITTIHGTGYLFTQTSAPIRKP
ncbi:response regulator [Dasania marina]|uniref:response regulator n=1 Tax=Dasania marina TaxID=471499 RepID=UPI00036AEF44|nr:response regulator [Dasania marina]|tara:strand:- start:79334 stop:80068 length:735 start_codon:yes stop_codon:yes gene_type:complete